MISAEYFRSKFEGDGRGTGPGVRAELHLVSGVVFEVAGVEEIEKGHVVLRVFPPASADAVSARRRPAPAALPASLEDLDRLVVSYESIACVHFAPAERHAERAAGF